jgi:hypothetical protein
MIAAGRQRGLALATSKRPLLQMYLAGETQMPSGMFKYAALLTYLLFLKDLCLPIACAEEPKLPATSTAIVIVDPTCDRFDAFTSDYLPAAQSEVVWVDGPEFGYFDYDHDSQLMLYIPAPDNCDSIDTFVVYATNPQGDWDIARFFFDPATRELVFARDSRGFDIPQRGTPPGIVLEPRILNQPPVRRPWEGRPRVAGEPSPWSLPKYPPVIDVTPLPRPSSPAIPETQDDPQVPEPRVKPRRFPYPNWLWIEDREQPGKNW